jgi:hypothetical protein
VAVSVAASGSSSGRRRRRGGGGGAPAAPAAPAAAASSVSSSSSPWPALPQPALALARQIREATRRTRRAGERPEDDAAAWAVERDGDSGSGGTSSDKTEVPRARTRVYVADSGGGGGGGHAPTSSSSSPSPNTQPWERWHIVDDPHTSASRMRDAAAAYLLPQGFPHSVAPQYATYMAWRGVQYFFGGAMSVYTTSCLLSALGVAGRRSGEAAAAVNWVLKDGAGRLGRFLFARWGRELDCELKQFRLAGDLLMECGAALELATSLAPGAFLPLACTANLAKNLAAVAASSTRAPIYRTFALSNNLADVTAKGESVANLADVLGTLGGIALSKWAKAPAVPAFCALSCGYLLASRREVDSVQLPYLNRARLAYGATAFFERGEAPGVPEANAGEPLLPWGGRLHQARVRLGATVEEACAGPAHLAQSAALYRGQRYIVTWRRRRWLPPGGGGGGGGAGGGLGGKGGGGAGRGGGGGGGGKGSEGGSNSSQWSDALLARMGDGASAALSALSRALPGGGPAAAAEAQLQRWQGRRRPAPSAAATRAALGGGKAYVILRAGATGEDALKAAFEAHLMIRVMEAAAAADMRRSGGGGQEQEQQQKDEQEQEQRKAGRRRAEDGDRGGKKRPADWAAGAPERLAQQVLEAERRDVVAGASATTTLAAQQRAASEPRARRCAEAARNAADELFAEFCAQSRAQGWQLAATMLNPGESRLVKLNV